MRPQTNTEVTVDGERIRAKLKPGSWTCIVTRAEPTPLGRGLDVADRRYSPEPVTPETA